MENNFINTIDKPAFDWNDFTLVAESLSIISSRQEVNVYNENGDLPLMTSPMTSVVNNSNWYHFFTNGFRVCMPRGVFNNSQQCFNSISLCEFETLVEYLEGNKNRTSESRLILVDIANGNINKLFELTKRYLKVRKSDKELMIGNLANPKSFKMYAELGVDYCRLGVGGGSACLTSANTGVHFPMASLISECYQIKKENNYTTKIVADGGFDNFDTIIKCLAAGSDFVMIGSILNKALESCGNTTIFGLPINKYKDFFWECKFLRKYIKKSYFGMSTKHAQKQWGRTELKTAEGIHKTQNVEYTLQQWRHNFESYLRSAMSYTNSKTLDEFKDCQKVFITNNSRKRYAK